MAGERDTCNIDNLEEDLRSDCNGWGADLSGGSAIGEPL